MKDALAEADDLLVVLTPCGVEQGGDRGDGLGSAEAVRGLVQAAGEGGDVIGVAERLLECVEIGAEPFQAAFGDGADDGHLIEQGLRGGAPFVEGFGFLGFAGVAKTFPGAAVAGFEACGQGFPAGVAPGRFAQAGGEGLEGGAGL